MRGINFLALIAFLGMGTANLALAQGPRKGMIRTQGSLAAGSDFRTGDSRYYLWGDTEYLLTDHVGVDGALILQAGSSQNEFPMNPLPGIERDVDLATHYSLFGLNWHFMPDRPVDVFVGFQPGWAVSQIPAHQDPWLLDMPEQTLLGPVASIHGGVAYYGSIFHVYSDLRLIGGSGGKSVAYDVRIGEVMASFGLGFNINTRKRP